MTGLIALGVILLILAAILVGANANDGPTRHEKRIIKQENKDLKQLREENLALRLFINRLDGMAQNEYDASNNLFAYTVRQEIVTNRKEIA